MSPQEARRLTRREKKNQVRPAVIAALRHKPASEFVSTVDFDDIPDRIVAIIQERRLVKGVPIDIKDVCLALRYWHAQGVVRVTHYTPSGDELHKVSLLRIV